MSYVWETDNLVKEFTLSGGLFKPKQTVHAVQGVSLYQSPGETLGIVGESGCGKPTFGYTLMGLYGERYAHELSGGQRQRIGIARALIMEPQCIICDEPISALDVSIQVQIMTLLERLQEQHGISYLFISHDLNMVRYISHRMVVMYLGAVMEEGPALDLYEFPQHPYTRALTALNGPVMPHAPIGAPLKGDPPNPLDPPKGCLFSGRCPEAEGRCFTERPPLRDWADRRIACWHI